MSLPSQIFRPSPLTLQEMLPPRPLALLELGRRKVSQSPPMAYFLLFHHAFAESLRLDSKLYGPCDSVSYSGAVPCCSPGLTFGSAGLGESAALRGRLGRRPAGWTKAQ